ncbi:hypothetical protein TTHERM_000091539 (macronuclear) [Tetrahymena thermophila SB210]|uniref:Uncharacterized protein n=1 Tax=Tetrahymena thermophila (strain SB210) TaxID=312017 RepID=W7XEP4_TETTS|nr:hypothetical protein TTHERM_000091539 [Tetrahymena thermophila SB210]EWS75198.1 hypothetical protein TTHERM_000091539 [Tetrahymena thermophila SB210]|eukprot:XP_012652189.1 hypothetical protein TTHERM_000091539 [Tetrahymena thermophila SB210]
MIFTILINSLEALPTIQSRKLLIADFLQTNKQQILQKIKKLQKSQKISLKKIKNNYIIYNSSEFQQINPKYIVSNKLTNFSYQINGLPQSQRRNTQLNEATP